MYLLSMDWKLIEVHELLQMFPYGAQGHCVDAGVEGSREILAEIKWSSPHCKKAACSPRVLRLLKQSSGIHVAL